MAIQSFGDKEAENFFVNGKPPKRAGWRGVASIVRRKLDMIRYAAELNDLRSPPGNRLEALSGGLKGFHSIRVNDQWRVIFRWVNRRAEDVRIVDYHN